MILALAVAGVVAVQSAAPAEAFDADARVTEAVAVVRQHAYRSRAVDWDRLEPELRSMAESARDAVDMLPVYHRLLQALGDGHSFVAAPNAAVEAFQSRYGRDPFPSRSREISSTFMDRSSRIAHQTYALTGGKTVEWITVPRTSGAGDAARDYAAHLFTATIDVPASTCGYVLDVRGNTGGNIWPMLTGLSGLLGDGPSNGQTNADGSITVYAELKEGRAVIIQDTEGKGNTLIESATWRPVPALAEAPVALLMDDATASSGEGVAVAFRGRLNTRSFGQPTWGASTANSNYPVSDGVTLWLTVGVMTDRAGTAYPNGLIPDQPVAFDAEGGAGQEDPQLEAARTWLAGLPNCRSAGG